MRADRLLSILMYLQTRGRTTTDRLAMEFEVSRRTIIRDLYALRVAGFPVYTERGPHGGCYLHDEYRNTLTQLTSAEVAALFVSNLQQPLKDLGLSDPLRGAILKLSAALPESRKAAGSQLANRIIIDSSPWSDRADPIGHLGTLYQATMADRWLFVVFARQFDVMTERTIAPYGLVAKAGTWFVIWAGDDGQLRVDRVSRIKQAHELDRRFDRPVDFDLDQFWAAWRHRQETTSPGFVVKLRVRSSALKVVQDALGARRGVFYNAPTTAGSWVDMDVSFSLLDEARRHLLALGGAVEVVEPHALRLSISDFADQIADVYRSPAP